MASVASQLIEKVNAHAQSYSLEDAREICADGTYFLNNLRIKIENLCNKLVKKDYQSWICLHDFSWYPNEGYLHEEYRLSLGHTFAYFPLPVFILYSFRYLVSIVAYMNTVWKYQTINFLFFQ